MRGEQARNIPSKCTQSNLMREINAAGFLGTYDPRSAGGSSLRVSASTLVLLKSLLRMLSQAIGVINTCTLAKQP